jgi:hypothetical protein
MVTLVLLPKYKDELIFVEPLITTKFEYALPGVVVEGPRKVRYPY